MRRLKIISFLASVSAFGIAAFAYQVGFGSLSPEGIMPNGEAVLFEPAVVQACFKAQTLTLLADRYSDEYWATCRRQLLGYRALDAFEFRSATVRAGAGIGLLSLFVFALFVRFGRASVRVTRGARLQTGAAGLKTFTKACAAEARIHGPGVTFLSGIPLGRDREARHFLILGSVGGGKTQTMLKLISEAIARGDGVLVLDTKGDMMAGLPADGDPLLVAPHDRRSLIWDIAADCIVKQDARELAARFIPPSSDPMWSQAAQEIFVACLVYLQAAKGDDWDWVDLESVVTSKVEKLTEYARSYNPNALRLLDQPDSKTTHSILTTFQTHMRIVSVLAEAWPGKIVDRFSIREWLHNPKPYRPLILQHDPGYPDLSRIWIGSMLGLLASAVGSPTLGESKDRRIWLFLDEFPQLPPISRFPTFLELGRSKGVCVVIGAQDTAQIRAVYGQDQAKSWFGMTGSKIITRVNASETAEDISRLIGDQETERPVKSTTRSGGRVSVSESIHRETRRVITASELGSRLGPTKHGVRVLFLGVGGDVYELELPYISLPNRREAIMPADWTIVRPPQPPANSNDEPSEQPQGPLSKDVADWIRRIRD